ncbi:MAG TPA: hypothetical protein VMH48_06810 [Methylomirabilota bacterium]|nr:hypothetical protein [Methylomirabilota bacterium]
MRHHFLTVSLAVAFSSLFFSSFARANDNDGCSNATLKGDYAFTVSGQIFLPTGPGTFQVVQRQGIAMTHFDGDGNLSQEDFVLSDPNAPKPGGVPPTDSNNGFHNDETGTYTVNKDCTGTFTIILPGLLDPKTGATVTSTGKIIVLFALSDHGRTIHTVVASIQPPGAPGPVPALIRSDGYKLGRVPED